MNIPNANCSSFIENINETLDLEKGTTGALYKQLSKEVQSFEKTLDTEHEVGMKLVSFGQSIQFPVTNIDYRNPHLFVFYGFLDDGSPIKLIQHVSQLSFLLVKVKRLNPECPKKPIGFRI